MFLATHLNRIAKSYRMRTRWARRLFLLDQEARDSHDNAHYHALMRVGIPHSVASSYVDLAPLLVENEAISRYLVRGNHFALRTALPEVISIDEAVRIATMDRFLTSEEATLLAAMLEVVLPP